MRRRNQRSRRDAFISSARKEGDELALIDGLGERAHQIRVGDGVDQPARRGGDFVGQRLGEHDATAREHEVHAEIGRRPDAQNDRVAWRLDGHQHAAEHDEARDAHRIHADDAQNADAGLTRLLHLLSELAGEIVLEVARRMPQQIDEEVFLREAAHARSGVEVDPVVEAIDRGPAEPDGREPEDPRQDRLETTMRLHRGGDRVDEMRERDRAERFDRRCKQREPCHRSHAAREMRADQEPDERERRSRDALKRQRLVQRLRVVDDGFGCDIARHNFCPTQKGARRIGA